MYAHMTVIGFVGFILFIALVIFIRLKKPKWKGKYSEKLVNVKLLELPEEYTVFHNLLFEKNGRSTQIDHIVISPYGVFVVETKGYKGWILGGEYSEKWTQVIYKSKYQFYNPIRQNEGHVRFLQNLLKTSFEIPFIPVVVFNNEAELKICIEDHIVVNRRDLKRVIKRYKTVVLNSKQISWIVQTIQKNSAVANREGLKRHKSNVKRIKYKTERDIRQGICPQCGGQLVLHCGKYGSFYGCANYPKCKFTTNR